MKPSPWVRARPCCIHHKAGDSTGTFMTCPAARRFQRGTTLRKARRHIDGGAPWRAALCHAGTGRRFPQRGHLPTGTTGKVEDGAKASGTLQPSLACRRILQQAFSCQDSGPPNDKALILRQNRLFTSRRLIPPRWRCPPGRHLSRLSENHLHAFRVSRRPVPTPR